MEFEAEKSKLFLSNLKVNKKSKDSIYNQKPIFCENGNSLIISIGKSCHLYNTLTGSHVKELFQCAEDIIACQLHPFQSSLIIAVTNNGEVTVYNMKTNEIESTVQLLLNKKIILKHNSPKFTSLNEEENKSFDWENQPLDSLACRKFVYAEVRALQKNPSNIFIFASWCLNDEVKSHLSVFSYKSGKNLPFINFKKTGLQKCYLNFAADTLEGSDVLVGMSYDYIQVMKIDIKNTNFYKRHYIGFNMKINCIALHPSECVLVTGDSIGRIIIWRNIFDNYPLKEQLIWHATPVHGLFFSSYGNYLFSGGEENVLVKWSLTSNNKDFLPRLSSAIHYITGCSESSLLSISTADNKILIVDFNFQKLSTIQHFSKWFVVKGNNKQSIFTVDPRSNCLVLNGRTGHIQFLSLKEDGKFVYTFDVTNRNYITSDSLNYIENTQVTHAKFNSSGKWLVTAEFRRGDFSKESRLKFWMYCEKERSFLLNTNVEFPHNESEILSLEISMEDKVATSGADKKFRLWTIDEVQHSSKTKKIWSLQDLKSYRDLPCYGIDFSRDASLIAVSFGSVLTIWETDLCTLKCSLSTLCRKEVIKFCKFGNNELSHLVVTGSDLNITVWNAVTVSFLWTVSIKLSLLINDPFSIYMAAFTDDHSLLIFNPASPNLELRLENVARDPVVAAHSVQNNTGKICLYFLTSNQDLFCLEDADNIGNKDSSNVPKTLLTPYTSQLAKTSNKVESEKSRILVNKSTNQTIYSLLDSPAHTIPNPSLLCADILKELLVLSYKQPNTVSSNSTNKQFSVKMVESSKSDLNIDFHQSEQKMLNLVQTIFV